MKNLDRVGSLSWLMSSSSSRSSCRLFSFIVFLIIITSNGHYYYCSSSSSSSDHIQTGYRFSLPVDSVVDNLFTGRAFIMEATGDGQQTPDFRVALSVVEEEDVDKKNKKLLFSCSLDVFLGEVRVWSSAHFFRFYALRECVLELTNEGDLLLKGQNQTIGWKTGTSGQGVQRLQLLRNGNLVLVDNLNQIKWQSFNFPTDTMLFSQTLNVATRLTSFPTTKTNSTSLSFSFDIEREKIALYLNSAANSKYLFWEFKPSHNRNLTFIKVSTQGLDIFDDRGKKISQIQSQRLEPIRFLALDNRTGSLGLYYYSAADGNFKAAFRVPNSTCDLPLACQPYEICTLTNVCSSSFINNNNNNRISCDAASQVDVEMVELRKVWSVIRGIPADTNMSSSKDRCAQFCNNNCKCAAALYNATSSRGGACFVYEFVRGLKELDLMTPLMAANKLTYMVKLRKEDTAVGKASSSIFKGWVLALVGATDALVLLLFFLGILYYCCVLSKRRDRSHPTNHPQQ